jgi:hypothetical protein
MGGSDEDKFDHPTQKPVELMRRPIANRQSANRQSANCADSGLEPFDAIDIAAVLRNTS